MNRTDSASDTVFRQVFTIEGGDFDRAGFAATGVKSTLSQIGFPSEVIRRASIVVYEAEMNVVMYANQGQFELVVRPDEIRLSLTDEGPGIENIDQAMVEGFSTASKEYRDMGFGAGMGLPNIRKNSDRFEICSTPGSGTTIEVLIRP